MGNQAQMRRDERAALLTTLREVGPEAPTLCVGWTAADVAAHLAMSERYWGLPLAALYPLRRIAPAPAREAMMARLRRVGDRQTASVRNRGWQACLRRLASGPPALYYRPSLAPIRVAEEWIHHEDIRRANAMGPRPAQSSLDGALWSSLVVLSGLSEFNAGRQSVEVSTLDGRRLSLQPGEPDVTVRGTVGEILMFLAGRCDAAQVEAQGSEAAMKQLREGLAV